jgi:hypothetical protein
MRAVSYRKLKRKTKPPLYTLTFRLNRKEVNVVDDGKKVDGGSRWAQSVLRESIKFQMYFVALVCLLPVALLILLAAPTRARLVAADYRFDRPSSPALRNLCIQQMVP